MDKQLLKAYIRTIVEEEVEKAVLKTLSEAIAEIRATSPTKKPTITEQAKPTIDRGRLAALLGLDYDRTSGTLTATSTGLPNNNLPVNASTSVPQEVQTALTRDYSALMKAMNLTDK
jgi:hypothetical protein